MIHFILVFIQAALLHAECPAGLPLEPGQMKPEQITAWLNGTRGKIKSAADLLCCLPASYRSGYAISHASIAAQNGSPESPRLVLKVPLHQGSIDGDVLILTVNGGASYLNQAENVEMGFYRKATRRPEFYDVAFDGKAPHVSAKNPAACMRCHGDGREPKHGAKFIFDSFGHWPRFVGGTTKCFDAEDRVQLAQQRRALEAVRDNPRFKCLERGHLDADIAKLALNAEPGASPPTVTGGDLTGFDAFLFAANDQRVARIVRDTPDFDAYKYLIVGEEECDPGAELDRWMPPQIVERHNHLGTIDPRHAHLDANGLRALIATARAEAGAQRARRAARAAAQIKDHASGLEPATQPFVCENSETDRAIAHLVGVVDLIKPPALRAYEIDARMRRRTLEIRGAPSALSRFIFEGRGIDMGSWGMGPAPGEYQTRFTYVADVIAAEPKNSVLSRILAVEPSATRCERLRAESRRALARLVRATPVAAPRAAR